METSSLLSSSSSSSSFVVAATNRFNNDNNHSVTNKNENITAIHDYRTINISNDNDNGNKADTDCNNKNSNENNEVIYPIEAASSSSLSSISSISSISSLSVLHGRIILCIAAAIYGSDFATVKLFSIDINNHTTASSPSLSSSSSPEQPILTTTTFLPPLSYSIALRFIIAAITVVLCTILSSIIQYCYYCNTPEQKKLSNNTNQQETSYTILRQRLHATIAGSEIGIWYCIGYIFQAIALSLVDSSKSAFYNSLVVVVVPLLDYTILKKEMKRTVVIAIIVAIIGVMFMEQPTVSLSSESSSLLESTTTINQNTFHNTTNSNYTSNNVEPIISFLPNTTTSTSMIGGDVYCLLQALFFGIGYWRLETISLQHPKNTIDVTIGQILALAFGSILYCIIDQCIINNNSGNHHNSNILSINTLIYYLSNCPISYIIVLLWTGVCSTVIALYCETIAIKIISAVELTIIMTSVSIWGCFFAYILLNEILTIHDIIGGILIIVACLIATL